MVGLVIDVFLLALLALIAVMVVRTGRLYAVIVMSGAYSLTSAAIFVNLDAVDVAFTEAAVGAGISTVLFLAAMAYIPVDEKPSQNRNFLAVVICIGAGALLLLAVMDLPSLGDAMAPVHQHVAPRYLAESGSALHIPNVVTTVLAFDFRGFAVFVGVALTKFRPTGFTPILCANCATAWVAIGLVKNRNTPIKASLKLTRLNP